jgi:hypothetical protein
MMNELGHCHDAIANCVRPTGPVSCAKLITKMTDDFQVVFFVDSWVCWCITVMHNPAIVKENKSAAP